MLLCLNIEAIFPWSPRRQAPGGLPLCSPLEWVKGLQIRGHARLIQQLQQ